MKRFLLVPALAAAALAVFTTTAYAHSAPCQTTTTVDSATTTTVPGGGYACDHQLSPCTSGTITPPTSTPATTVPAATTVPPTVTPQTSTTVLPRARGISGPGTPSASASPGQLAFTGSNTGPLAAVAAVLILAGAGLTVLARRRLRSTT